MKNGAAAAQASSCRRGPTPVSLASAHGNDPTAANEIAAQTVAAVPIDRLASGASRTWSVIGYLGCESTRRCPPFQSSLAAP